MRLFLADAKEMKSFLFSMVWRYRFMRNVINVINADPLWKLTKTGFEWRWTEIEQKAFGELKAH